MILLPLRPTYLTHKNLQRRKIIQGMRPIGRKDRSIDLKTEHVCVFVEYPVRLFSVAVITGLFFNDAYFF